MPELDLIVDVENKEDRWSNIKGEERKRQEAILELLKTEETFLNRLKIIKEVIF